MKEQAKPEYREKDTVAVDMTEVRFKRLREAYLAGRLVVDSKRLAEKLLKFEGELSVALEPNKRKNR